MSLLRRSLPTHASTHAPMQAIVKCAAFAAAFLGVLAPAARAHACSASETEVYRSAKTAWCVENSVITQYGAFPKAFYAYGDNVVDELPLVFDVPVAGLYTFEASVPSGGAHTGSECCGLGVTVTGDAFYNDGFGAVGYWGYLLSLHEMINDWTGQVSSGWPTDFWADHVSAFPNSMDWHIMDTLGKKDNDANLLKASVAQKARFYPGGSDVDPRVPMFDQIYDSPGYGYPGFSRVFGIVQSDKVSWDDLGVNNPDVKRTEYVMAYLSLGGGALVTATMQKAHVGDGTDDGAGDPGYVVDAAHIDAIANAHCAIVAAEAQGTKEDTDWKALRGGNYSAVTAKGKCGTGCPSECGCKTAANLCVAPWLGDKVPGSDGGTSSGGDGGGTGSGGDGGPGGVTADGGTVGPGGGGPGAGTGADGGAGNGAGGGSGDGASSGCSCSAVGGEGASSRWLSMIAAASALLAVGIVRAGGRRRG